MPRMSAVIAVVSNQPAPEANQDRCQVVSHGSYVTFQMAAVATPARQATDSAGDSWPR